MGKKLFVGGLSWDTTNDSLRAAFSPFGEVMEAKVITDRETGKSRGFGFVTFADAATADEALGVMNETELDGRRIRVDMAEDKRGGGNRRGGNDRPKKGNKRGGRPRYDDDDNRGNRKFGGRDVRGGRGRW